MLVAAGWPEQSGAARRRTMERKLEALGGDVASATTSLRLVSLGGPRLMTTQFHQGKFTESLAALVDGTRAGELKTAPVRADSLPTITTLPGPPPDWDALSHGDGSMAVVWTVAGSAVSHLSYKNRKDAVALTVNSGMPFGVFGGPRFVGGGQTDSVVAIASLSEQDPSVMMFRQPAEGGFEMPKSIDVSWRGIPTAAKLIQLSDGYLACVKVFPSGGQIANAQPRRAFGARLIQPGWLDIVRLSSDLKPAPAAAQLQTDVVFEFDLVAVGNRAALLTTTSTGGTVLFLDEQGQPIAHAGHSQAGMEIHLNSAGPLTSPSLLFLNRVLYVAAIADAGPTARVVGTKVDVTSLD
jgi:hypothetical protein